MDYEATEKLYQVAYDGAWTFEKMYADAKLVSNEDINLWGIANELDSASAFLASADTFTVRKDDDGVLRVAKKGLTIELTMEPF